MASSSHTVVLPPLDQYMPRIYTNLFLVFDTVDPSHAVDKLKAGLQTLNQRLPYLKGRVFATDGGRVALRWCPTDKEVELQEMPIQGTVLFGTSLKTLQDEGAPLHYFPPSLSPLARVADLRSDSGAPVFAVNHTVLDGGLVVGISVQHNVMDGTGVVELIRFWAACTQPDPTDAATPTPDPDEPLHRSPLLRLATGHITQNQHQAQPPRLSFSDLLARHPEFTLPSNSPPPATLPGAPLPKGTSKIFTFATSKLEAVKATLQSTTDTKRTAETTNSVLCATIWSCITRVRAARRGQQGPGAVHSKLGFAINGRARLDPSGQTLSTRPFLGNVNLYGLAAMSVSDLEHATTSYENLAAVVQAIAGAIQRVTPGHVAEVMELVEQAPDAGALMPGWSSFHSADVTVTSWANMGVYGADFGEGVGRPELMRVPEMQADGFAIVLPRKRAEGVAGCIEVVLVLHPEDVAALEGDAVWMGYLA
ncbi:trichothecene 3-O-acetyltransferase [Parachaetomium inaequale]|uniref:Trichothecene 3-O-acetyltransferase n=1 Tax=Parachaetomium inaequale TaxID=2588326 RepID=A0AAN6PFF2_9PEZI|nr:trichothecene 3-O-acetyltransferase [Parachaetomium inaequale]